MVSSVDQAPEFRNSGGSANENLNSARIARNVWLVLFRQPDL